MFLKKILPHTTITIKGKPYLTRYYVFGADRTWGNIYIHHFHSSDQGLNLHNHPWSWGLSIVLWGGYYEERVQRAGTPVNVKRRIVKPGSINLITASDYHRVDLMDEKRGAWTLFFAGPRTKDWGFLNRETGEFTDFRQNPEAIP